MKKNNAVDKLLSSPLWLSGEPFTVQDMRLSLGCKASTVLQALRDIGDRVHKTTHGCGNGHRMYYSRRAVKPETAKKVYGRWVSPEWTDTGKGPLEWRRGA